VFKWPFKDLICQFIASSGSSGWQIAHVLELGVEDDAGLLPQLVFVHQLLQQRQLDRLAGVAPKLVAAGATTSGGCQSQTFAPDETKILV